MIGTLISVVLMLIVLGVILWAIQSFAAPWCRCPRSFALDRERLAESR